MAVLGGGGIASDSGGFLASEGDEGESGMAVSFFWMS